MVTEGAGYIGKPCGLALLDAGYLVVVDNLITDFAWAVDPCATLVEANVADKAVRGVIRDHGVNAILHSPGRSWCRNRSSIRSNITATTPSPRAR